MSKQNDGGPAYPRMSVATEGYDGMSLRDYFAGQALAGLIVARCQLAIETSDCSDAETRLEVMKPSSLAGESYRHADAMLREREKVVD